MDSSTIKFKLKPNHDPQTGLPLTVALFIGCIKSDVSPSLFLPLSSNFTLPLAFITNVPVPGIKWLSKLFNWWNVNGDNNHFFWNSNFASLFVGINGFPFIIIAHCGLSCFPNCVAYDSTFGNCCDGPWYCISNDDNIFFKYGSIGCADRKLV